MSANYERLDALLLERIEAGFKTLSFVLVGDAYREARSLTADATDAFDLGERRLHSLQQRGLVRYDAEHGWTPVPQPPKKTLKEAIAEGQAAMERGLAAEEKKDPHFGEKVRQFFLGLLNATPGRCMRGEEMTDAAVKAGFITDNTRRFGGVISGMAKAGMIHAIGTYKRTKGHGTAGGQIWQLSGVWQQQQGV